MFFELGTPLLFLLDFSITNMTTEVLATIAQLVGVVITDSFEQMENVDISQLVASPGEIEETISPDIIADVGLVIFDSLISNVLIKTVELNLIANISELIYQNLVIISNNILNTTVNLSELIYQNLAVISNNKLNTTANLLGLNL